MTKTILITGASSGFGAMTSRALADAGHTVFASMRDVEGRNRRAADDARAYATDRRSTCAPPSLTSQTRRPSTGP